MRDLGVIVDSKLKFTSHVYQKINKAYSMLGVIKRNFKYMDSNVFIMLYKAFVQSHLEYALLLFQVRHQLNTE